MSVFVDSLREEMDNVPGLNEFFAVLDIPDLIFDQAFDSVKEEIIKSYKSADFKNQLLEIVENGEAGETLSACQEILELMDSDEDDEIDISNSKKEFLKVVFQGLADGLKETMEKPYTPVSINIEFCHENAKVPAYAHEGDAGMDIYAVEDITIAPGVTALVKTGLKVAIPFGYELQVRPRSGMSLKTGIRIANAPGTIDCGYRDEIGIIAHNTAQISYEVKAGDRIAQLVLQKVPFAEFVIVDSVADIGDNRKGGFGSSGK